MSGQKKKKILWDTNHNDLCLFFVFCELITSGTYQNNGNITIFPGLETDVHFEKMSLIIENTNYISYVYKIVRFDSYVLIGHFYSFTCHFALWLGNYL